jgi:homoserine/homoserine lactone efflux protein
MELHVYVAFVIATVIMISLPGPSVLLTVAHSISFGWKRGIITVTGATTGIAIQLVIAAIGLTSLLNVCNQGFNFQQKSRGYFSSFSSF